MLLLQPLRHRAMALLWGGLALSAVGDQAYNVAFAWIATEAFGTGAGFLVALGPLAGLMTLAFGGRIADALPPGRAMVWADLARAAALLIVVAGWTAAGRPPASALMLAVVVLAAGMAVFRPALQAVLPPLLPDRGLLPAANALLDGTERIARLLGPALAGLLSAVLPLQHLLTLDAATFLASAAAVWAIGRRHDIPAIGRTLPGGGLAGFLHGFRAVRRHPVLGYVAATSGVLNGAWYAAYFLLLPLATQAAGLPLSGYGLVISAYGCTNLAGNLVVGSRPMPANPARQVFFGNLCLGLGILGVGIAAAAPSGWLLPVAMAASGLAAVGGPMQDIPVAVLRQTALPRGDVPAATRAMMASSQSGVLAALVLAPFLAAVLPLAGVIGLCGAAVLVIGAEGLRRLG
ncbi:MAG TPA: MFS transporter [Acetobacteraceae bacterium]